MSAADSLSIVGPRADSRRWYGGIKRALDLIVSAILLVVSAPLFVACALAVVLDTPGPALFRQERVGEGGRTFTLFKFRTMVADADPARHRAYVAALIRGDATGFPTEAGKVYKIVDDDRITRAGRWLRRTSLDELPQLWNVLRGEMSLVGPRPALSYEVEQYGPAHRERLTVKPGITGWWQVNGRCTTSFEEMIQLDLEYIRRRSVLLDLWIVIRTIPVVMTGHGAH